MNTDRLVLRVLSITLALVLTGAARLSLAQGAEPEGGAMPSQGEPSPQAIATGTAFTYQGRLVKDGVPVNGTCNFKFKLWDAASNGNQIGSTQDVNNVQVTSGLFTVQLDFGTSAFQGDPRWLQVLVECAGESSYTTLTPRQPLTPSPYALALPGLWTQQNGTSPNVIGGYAGNSVTGGVVGATIGGGGTESYPNQVISSYGTVGGGAGNKAAFYGTVGGGLENTADYLAATVSGGQDNMADQLATVGGGSFNTASGYLATICGGTSNTAQGDGAVIGGGGYDGTNIAGNQAMAPASTIGGGMSNVITTTGMYATIGGGWRNHAGGGRATIAGGEQNTADRYLATVGGGFNNTAGERAVVGGGVNNTASGTWATIPGGDYNLASGKYSFAAGHRAKANANGCFVWGDSTAADINCNTTNRTVFRSTGGFYIYTNADLSLGAYLAAGSGSWSTMSDRNAKENFAPVDPRVVLEGVARLPITTWNYKTQDDAIRHMGPMAQDFHATFGLGEDDTHISTIDADGVALAAIQGLNQKVQAQEARIAALEAQNAALLRENDAQQRQIDDLEARLAALERAQQAPPQARTASFLPGLGMLFLGGGAAWTLWQRRGGQR